MSSETGREHFVEVPQFALAIRILQIVTAIVVLGLAGYGITYFSFDGDDLMLFTAVATLIIAGYVLVASLWVPVLYNYWAMMALDIFAIVFWIISFSLLASEVAGISTAINYYEDCYYSYCYRKRSVIKARTTSVFTYRNALAAACGLGGLEFILFAITLAFLSLGIRRHRAAGGHSMPVSSYNAAAAAAAVEAKPQDHIVIVPVQQVGQDQQYVQVQQDQQFVPVQVVPQQQYQQYPVQQPYQQHEVPQPAVSPVYGEQNHHVAGQQPVDGLHPV